MAVTASTILRNGRNQKNKTLSVPQPLESGITNVLITTLLR